MVQIVQHYEFKEWTTMDELDANVYVDICEFAYNTDKTN
jgi:hypothetical protein